MVNIRSRIGWNSRAAGRTWPTRLWVKTLVPGWYPKSQSHSWLMDVYSPDRRCHTRMERTSNEIKIVCAHQRPIERQLRRRNHRVFGFHQGFTPNPKGPETSVDPSMVLKHCPLRWADAGLGLRGAKGPRCLVSRRMDWSGHLGPPSLRVLEPKWLRDIYIYIYIYIHIIKN